MRRFFRDWPLAVLFLLGFRILLWPQFLATQLEQNIVDEQNRAEILGTALIHPLRNSDLAQIYSILDSVLENHPHWRHIVLKELIGRVSIRLKTRHRRPITTG